jgi:hypothetical protein
LLQVSRTIQGGEIQKWIKREEPSSGLQFFTFKRETNTTSSD